MTKNSDNTVIELGPEKYKQGILAFMTEWVRERTTTGVSLKQASSECTTWVREICEIFDGLDEQGNITKND